MKSYFPILIPPEAFVYRSKNSLDDPNGSTTSEYESCILRGVKSTSTVVKVEKRGRSVEVVSASAHNMGIRLGMILEKVSLFSSVDEDTPLLMMKGVSSFS